MAIDSNELSRPLPFPLKHPESGNTEAPESEPQALLPFEWNELDSDAVISVRMDLSLNEYVALATAIDVGRDIAFNDDSNWIWQIWTKAYRGLADVMSCEDIADCIETNQSVQDAIAASNTANGLINPDQMTDTINNYINQRFPATQRDEPIAPPPDECDLDALWTGILEIVTRLDENSRDAWQDLSAIADKADRIAEAIAIIPLLGDVPGEILEFLAEVIPDLLTAYEAHSSTEVLEDIACDLFSLVCAECRYPTANELYNYYASFGVTGIQDLLSYGVDAAVDYLIGSSTLANAVVFFTTNAIQLYFRYLGGTWLGKRGLKWLAIWANIGEDNPNNGWELLCDGCDDGTWTVEFDFTVTDGGFVRQAGANRGDWINGVGWQSTQKPTVTQTQGITIQKALPLNCNIKEVSFDFDMDGNTWVTRCMMRDNPASTSGEIVVFGSIDITTTPNCGYGDIGAYHHRNYILLVLDNGVQNTIKGRITKLRIHGEGTIIPDYTSLIGSAECL